MGNLSQRSGPIPKEFTKISKRFRADIKCVLFLFIANSLYKDFDNLDQEKMLSGIHSAPGPSFDTPYGNHLAQSCNHLYTNYHIPQFISHTRMHINVTLKCYTGVGVWRCLYICWHTPPIPASLLVTRLSAVAVLHVRLLIYLPKGMICV